MFLRITALLMLLLVPFYGEGSLLTTDRYENNDAETDVTILKSILSRHPDDIKTLKRLIDLTFSLEHFDETEKYCEQYLAVKKNSEAAYLKIISAASLGKFKNAAEQVETFINDYKDELSERDITLLKYRENLYRKSTAARGFPAGAKKTEWGKDSLIKTIIPRNGLFAGYNFAKNNHTIFKVSRDSDTTTGSNPDFLSGFSAKSVNSVSLSDDGREVLISSGSGDSSEIYIRRYLADKNRWSRWENPGELNPGKWNHYPNFINNNTILFSSSDGSDYDLYISQRDKDGGWSRAEKLSGINTPFDEISAWVHPDGETLYFSSNGYEGMGGFDIYGAHLVQRENKFEATDIKNIAGANTFRNEKYPLFVTPSGSAAYFNFREGNKYNVYSCNEINYKPLPVFFYNADVVDDTTGTPLDKASAEYRDQGTDYKLNRKVYTDGFTGTTLHRNKKYTLTLSAEGYEQFSKEISFNGKDDLVNDTIRLKRTTKKQGRSDYVTLITALKLVHSEELRALAIQDTLVNGIGLVVDNVNTGKNIPSFTECGDTDCAMIDGKTVKADFVVFGTLVKNKKSAMKSLGDYGEDQYIIKRVSETKYTLELKLLDTASGKVMVSSKKTTGNSESLKSITNEFIKKTKKFYK